MFMPDVFRTTLRITYERSGAASTSAGQLLFPANSAFDPLGSSGTSQPVGFDPLALMYNRYRVLASRITARLMLQSTSVATATDGSFEFSMCYQNTATNLGSVQIAASQPGAKMALVTLQKPTVLTLSASTSEVTGRKSVEGSDSLQADTSSDPAEVWYWASYFVSGAVYTNALVEIHYTIEQDVEFFDRNTLSHSSFLAALKHAVAVKHTCNAKALVDGKAQIEKQRAEFKEEIKRIDVSDDDDAPVIVPVTGKNGQQIAGLSCVDPDLLKRLTPSVKRR